MLGCEVWLCRVLLRPGPVGGRLKGAELSDASHAAVLSKVIAGELAILPDDCIVEPVEAFASELDAAAARERMLRDRPGDDWRVVITMAVGS